MIAKGQALLLHAFFVGRIIVYISLIGYSVMFHIGSLSHSHHAPHNNRIYGG